MLEDDSVGEAPYLDILRRRAGRTVAIQPELWGGVDEGWEEEEEG